MQAKNVNQFGKNSIFIEKNNGNVYITERYVEETTSAFHQGSYELREYNPTIDPAIPREEVNQILEWIEKDASTNNPVRLGLLYGKAGIGKSIVMHELLKKLHTINDYLVLGLKSDQIEFLDTDELSKKIHLGNPLEIVLKEMAKKYKRVVVLIDQIDALSLSLSSNRTPLRSLLKMIHQIQGIPHIRVVISCRPYDLKYDPELEKERIKKQWELKELSKEQVQETLQANQCKERLSDNLLCFLGNPLNLYLFLKVRQYEQLTDPLSTNMLYHQLWRKYINDDSIRKVDKNTLLSLLDSLVDTMYERQELSVHIRTFETQYNAELNYLFTNGLLIETQTGLIQFFHQTLFDYVYARRFIEKGHNLLEVLKTQHQGLFTRASVKSILTFLREQDIQQYINTIEGLLYTKNENGKDTYRFHLKALALSNIPFFEKPLQEELRLITQIYTDKKYMNIIFESVYTPNWFYAIWGIVDSMGGWINLNTEYKQKAMVMCFRTFSIEPNIVLNKLELALNLDDEEDCKHLSTLLQYNTQKCDSKKLIAFYNKLVKFGGPSEYTSILKNILNDSPSFVCEELKKNIILQSKDNKVYHIGVNYEVRELYEELLDKHYDLGIKLLVEVLTIIYESTNYNIDNAEIYYSTAFDYFQRVEDNILDSNFSQEAANILIDNFLKTIDTEQTKRHIETFSKSKHEGFVFIALYLYTSHPECFKDDVYKIITNRQVLANAPAWVEYQAVEALRVSFPLMSIEQKRAIVERILAINDKGEYRLMRESTEIRLKYGVPLLRIDSHKGKALHVIPKEELRDISWKAYQEHQRIERKFNKNLLRNEKPSSIFSYVGWPSLKQDQGVKMSKEDWLNSMLKYADNLIEWEKPSLTGQCQLFRNVVDKEPEKYLDLIKQTIKNEQISLAYPLAGLEGLLNAKKINDAMDILKDILDAINNDLNTTERGFSIHSLLIALNDVINNEDVPELVFHLLCNIVINAKEPEEDKYQDAKDIFNIGIKQSRGNAGYMLVNCAYEKKYKEDIFKTIEKIAKTASVYTRAAILLNLAKLNWLDQNRNLALFKKLLHDYNPRLMALPVHNYNPLVYFVNYAIDDLIDFFQHTLEYPECYKVQVIILWLGWLHNHKDERLKKFIDQMCNKSEDARLSLLRFLSGLKDNINQEAVDYILDLMDSRFETKEMGEAFDNLFYHIKNWPITFQYQIAEAFAASPLSKYQIRNFIKFLGAFAVEYPEQTLEWISKIIEKNTPDDVFTWNNIVEVVIQSYNSIKTFNNNSNQKTLEFAMDLIDTIMQSGNNKTLITNFINKLDNE
ncbi:NACHT domain-containing protein [Prevotella pallens]|jgi:hypothetical protein|uniref:ATPase family protein associated with various cellular activities (AAA) n=2 Tax=Prevotella pallens TaxID=60133 RepID=A0ABX9DNU8_9BACT|nr:ATP-binding protein [Prevotella pallens]EGQ18165.1 hypothetical protein HMPREF9144_1248 [Prevotella pallens ATCC 700821]RAS42500.1 ATPase family protein associated with various cellular activities (AAA) [Prevotella pallens]